MLKNVKSKLIMNLIFKHVKNKRKLKITKYNKRMQNILYITKKDFEVYETLKELNDNII